MKIVWGQASGSEALFMTSVDVTFSTQMYSWSIAYYRAKQTAIVLHNAYKNLSIIISIGFVCFSKKVSKTARYSYALKVVSRYCHKKDSSNMISTLILPKKCYYWPK